MTKKRNSLVGLMELGNVSLCPHCYCMTYTIKLKCGKCKKDKNQLTTKKRGRKNEEDI